jgi:hypothetical protein
MSQVGQAKWCTSPMIVCISPSTAKAFALRPPDEKEKYYRDQGMLDYKIVLLREQMQGSFVCHTLKSVRSKRCFSIWPPTGPAAARPRPLPAAP